MFYKVVQYSIRTWTNLISKPWIVFPLEKGIIWETQPFNKEHFHKCN